MSEKRRDNKGRVLQKGESQRKDLTYQYRFTDPTKKRITVYAPTLKELREKEEAINRKLLLEGEYSRGQIPIIDMMRRYMSINKGIRITTRANYESSMRTFETDPFSTKMIGDIKKSDIKLWAVDRYSIGLSYSMIDGILKLMKTSLEMAVEEDVIGRNPARFKLSKLIKKTSFKREALTEEQQKKWLDFIKNDPVCNYNYDCMVILLGTGMRISEFCGLTINDLDFEARKISINHQLLKTSHGEYYIEKPKTEKGTRFIPMTDDVYVSLKRMIANRRKAKIERVIDGYHGFIAITKRGTPHNYRNYDHNFQTAMRRFRAANPDYVMPNITPHVLRHTFCTNMANSGMGIKSLQYLMGHSTVNITLELYSHNSYDQARKEMLSVSK